LPLLNRDDLILMPEAVARQKAGSRIATLRVVSPIGPFAGVGTLRVLRARPTGDSEQTLELVCGYEAYELLEKPEA